MKKIFDESKHIRDENGKFTNKGSQKPKLGDSLFDDIMDQIKSLDPVELPKVELKPFKGKKDIAPVFGWTYMSIPGSKTEYKCRTTTLENIWDDPKNEEELQIHLKALEDNKYTDNLALAYGIASSPYCSFDQWGDQLIKFKKEDYKDAYLNLLMLGTKRYMKFCEELPEKVQDISMDGIMALQNYFNSISVADIEWILLHSSVFTKRGLNLLKGHPHLGQWRQEILNKINKALVAME